MAGGVPGWLGDGPRLGEDDGEGAGLGEDGERARLDEGPGELLGDSASKGRLPGFVTLLAEGHDPVSAPCAAGAIEAGGGPAGPAGLGRTGG